MSQRTDKLAAQAKLAADKANQDAKVFADKLAAAEAADADEASKSPADKALERAFVRGTLPEEDRRAAGFPPSVILDGGVDGVPIVADLPPTGVRSPANLEIDLNARDGVDVAPGTPVPPLVPAELIFPNAPGIPQSSETRGPLVSLTPVLLDQEHPSTVEAAVALQHIPNDQIHAVFEDAAGVKRDALGHIIDATPLPVVPRKTGKGFA